MSSEYGSLNRVSLHFWRAIVRVCIQCNCVQKLVKHYLYIESYHQCQKIKEPASLKVKGPLYSCLLIARLEVELLTNIGNPSLSPLIRAKQFNINRVCHICCMRTWLAQDNEFMKKYSWLISVFIADILPNPQLLGSLNCL